MDPMGVVVADLGLDTGVRAVDISLETVARVREAFPMFRQRRLLKPRGADPVAQQPSSLRIQAAFVRLEGAVLGQRRGAEQQRTGGHLHRFETHRDGDEEVRVPFVDQRVPCVILSSSSAIVSTGTVSAVGGSNECMVPRSMRRS